MPDIQKLNVGGTDFDIDDPNDVEKEGGELLDTVINYDSATTPTIGSFTAFLNQFVSGTKVGQWFKNFRAGCDFLLHIGSIVNNCVSDNEALPLSAAQGKVLMDLYTELNDNLTELEYTLNTELHIPAVSIPSDTSYKDIRDWFDNYWREKGLGASVVFAYVGSPAIPYGYSLYLCWTSGGQNGGILCLRNGYAMNYTGLNSGGWSSWYSISLS